MEIKQWKDVLHIVSGKNQKAVENPNGKYPIYGSGGLMGYADDYLCEAGTTIVGRKGTINRPIFVTEPFWNIDTAFGITPDKGLVPKYLYYFCVPFNFMPLDKSTGRPSLAKSDLLKIERPVPPLPEQERIVARIEELFSQLDAGVETLKKTKAQLSVYRQAVLKEAFENISTFVPLSDVCQRVFDGPFGSNLKTSDYVSSGVRVVRLENLKNMWFDDSKQSFIANEKYELIASHTVFPTDLIMSTFISDSIKVCRLPNYIEYAVNKADCVGIRLIDNVNPDFVMFWLSSKEAYNRLAHQIHGATRPRVNTKQIKAIQIPSVKKDVQDKIVSVIQAKFSVCDNIEQTVDTALQQAEAMRQSILKDAFEGRAK